jgi:membrane-associated phospholipid phosphatase
MRAVPEAHRAPRASVLRSWTRRSPFDVLKRVAAWALTGITVLATYGATKLQPFGPAVELPLTTLDRLIPFMPWTVWVYGTVTWAALLAWLHVPDGLRGRRLYFTLALATAVCGVFFLFMPTTFPRHLYPVDPASITLRELIDLRAADSPTNCLPSLHVALATSLSANWLEYAKSRRARVLIVVWTVAVCLSTLTTKQHFVVDVAAGLVVGAGAYLAVHRWVRPGHTAFWARARAAFAVDGDADLRARLLALRERVAGHQWSLDDLDWTGGPHRPLSPLLIRLINEVIYIEEIAGRNFRLLGEASVDPDLRALYGYFAAEEARHAEGLRRVLELHGAPIRAPGLGASLVLDQFDSLDASSDADAILVAMANPVFETFLDAGTIPFLRHHPALASPTLEAFVERVCRDEAAHLALNWMLTRHAARTTRGRHAVRMLLNPSIYRGMAAIPFMALDVYSLAYRAGYDYRTLLGPFKRLWRLHRRYTELAVSPLWSLFRVFVVVGATVAVAAIALQRAGLFCAPLWTTLTRLTDIVARFLFGNHLLERRGLPLPTGPARTALSHHLVGDE